MKFKLLVALLIINCNYSLGQNCNCKVLLNKYKTDWKELINNADSFRMISFKKVRVITSKKEKYKAIQALLNWKWAAEIATEHKVVINLVKHDSLFGRRLEFTKQDSFANNSVHYNKSVVQYYTKDELKRILETRVNFGDIYYNVYYQIGRKTFISPTICSIKECTIFDNILGNLEN